jgi:hypothetical protein
VTYQSRVQQAFVVMKELLTSEFQQRMLYERHNATPQELEIDFFADTYFDIDKSGKRVPCSLESADKTGQQNRESPPGASKACRITALFELTTNKGKAR